MVIDMPVKETGVCAWKLEYVVHDFYARFDTHSYQCCRETHIATTIIDKRESKRKFKL